MAQSSSFGWNAGHTMHEVRMPSFCCILCSNMEKIAARFRFAVTPHIMTAVPIMNDTGSNMQIILPGDLVALQHNPATSPLGVTHIQTAGGMVARPVVDVEVQIMGANGFAMTDWLQERAVVGVPGDFRLSGNVMRNHLYFATAPGNTELYVAVKKHGLTTLLPAV